MARGSFSHKEGVERVKKKKDKQNFSVEVMQNFDYMIVASILTFFTFLGSTHG